MKKAWSFLQVVAGLLILGALAVGLAVAFRALSGSGAAGALPGTPQGYPPPEATVPAPEATVIQATRIAQATAMEAIEATRMAALTASAPSPIPTPGPLIGPQTIYDPVNHFSLKLPSGWSASVPSANALAGVTVIVNYDDEQLVDDHTYPPDGLKIQIGAGPLPSGQSFEQWLSDWLTYRTIEEFPGPRPTSTEPIPYQLGRYEGMTFTRIGLDYTIMEIALPLNGKRVMSISLIPADSPALEEALAMLSALEISQEPLP